MLKRFILWDFPRASWQYDLIVALILAFIFLTPRDLFRDQPRIPHASSTYAAAIDPPASVMERMDKAAATFKSLSAGIHKVAHTDVVNVDDAEDGTIVVKKYKAGDIRIRIDFTGARQQKVVVGGGKA